MIKGRHIIASALVCFGPIELAFAKTNCKSGDLHCLLNAELKRKSKPKQDLKNLDKAVIKAQVDKYISSMKVLASRSGVDISTEGLNSNWATSIDENGVNTLVSKVILTFNVSMKTGIYDVAEDMKEIVDVLNPSIGKNLDPGARGSDRLSDVDVELTENEYQMLITGLQNAIRKGTIGTGGNSDDYTDDSPSRGSGGGFEPVGPVDPFDGDNDDGTDDGDDGTDDGDDGTDDGDDGTDDGDDGTDDGTDDGDDGTDDGDDGTDDGDDGTDDGDGDDDDWFRPKPGDDGEGAGSGSGKGKVRVKNIHDWLTDPHEWDLYNSTHHEGNVEIQDKRKWLTDPHGWETEKPSTITGGSRLMDKRKWLTDPPKPAAGAGVVRL